MKKALHISFISLLAVISAMSMEHDKTIRFIGDHSIIPIKESHVRLMKQLHRHAQKDPDVVKRGGLVERYPHLSSEAMVLVHDALKVRPDKFKDYYNKLSEEKCHLLIVSSGQYNAEGKKVMLDVPEVTQRLIDVYFSDDLRKYIKKYIGTDDEDYVRAYFKEKLILSKSLLTLKEPKFYDGSSESVWKEMYLGSCFIDAVNTLQQPNYPISLRIGDNLYRTYATYFGTDNYEYRITDLVDTQCTLWVINHDNRGKTFSTAIKHKKPIKACRFGGTGTDVEYVLTYSKCDIILSTITMQNGIAFVESKKIDAPEKTKIVDICFDSVNNDWLVGLYRGCKTVFKRLNKEGNFELQVSSFPFKDNGLLQRILSHEQDEDCYFTVIYGIADQLKFVEYKQLASNAIADAIAATPLYKWYNNSWCYSFWNSRFVELNDCLHVFNHAFPFFTRHSEIQQNNKQNNFTLATMWNYFSSQPVSKIHRVYSPDGTLLMCNSLKNKLGILYVETVIKDAVTHKDIISFDTVYKNFIGIGFTHDGTELVVIPQFGPYQCVALLNDADKRCLQALEGNFIYLGRTAWLKRLCQECKERGIITLSADDSSYELLREWAKKTPATLEFLQKCLPMRSIKESTY